MKKYILLIFLLPIFTFAQNDQLNESENVTGIIKSSDGCYLILGKGFIQITRIDPYIEYYRKIYKDSTLINPNTEVKENFNFDIIPFLSPQISQQKIEFDEPQKLGLFLQMKEFGGINLTPYAEKYLESLDLKNSK